MSQGPGPQHGEGLLLPHQHDPVKDKPGEPPKKGVTDDGHYMALTSLMRMPLQAKLDMSEEEWDVILKECGVLKSNKNWNKNCEGPGGVFNEICIHQARLYNKHGLCMGAFPHDRNMKLIMTCEEMEDDNNQSC